MFQHKLEICSFPCERVPELCPGDIREQMGHLEASSCKNVETLNKLSFLTSADLMSSASPLSKKSAKSTEA